MSFRPSPNNHSQGNTKFPFRVYQQHRLRFNRTWFPEPSNCPCRPNSQVFGSLARPGRAPTSLSIPLGYHDFATTFNTGTPDHVSARRLSSMVTMPSGTPQIKSHDPVTLSDLGITPEQCRLAQFNMVQRRLRHSSLSTLLRWP